MNMNVVTVDILSTMVSARDADHSAHGTAITTAMNWAMTSSINVRGSRSVIRLATGG